MGEPKGSGGAALRDGLRPGIYALIDLGTCRARGLDPLALARAFCREPLAALQLRAKEGTDRERLALARALAPLCRAAGIPFVVDDRADLALLAGADGVHVGRDDLPPARVRALLGPERLIGWSTHDAAQVAEAAREPVDYVGFGPVFATRTKENPDPVVGLAGLRAAADHDSHPVVAIGGIGLGDLPAIRATGARAAALVTALLDGDPAERIAEAVRRFGRSQGPARR
jgi:thiamine-phosphate pyrophosphorylase